MLTLTWEESRWLGGQAKGDGQGLLWPTLPVTQLSESQVPSGSVADKKIYVFYKDVEELELPYTAGGI